MDSETRATLEKVLEIYSVRDVARVVGQCERSVKRWGSGECAPDTLAVEKLKELLGPPHVEDRAEGEFTFIDMFAGIGGTRLAFEDESVGGKCVFTSEWDEAAKRTYQANFGDEPIPGDITKISSNMIPDHDVLLGGFPCQPFSLAGVSKKNSLGRDHGFLCQTQGTLFFEIQRILEEKRPKAFLLENVKHLQRHNRGKTFETIRGVIDELDYTFDSLVIDSSAWVPQKRERIFMVGFDRKRPGLTGGLNIDDFSLADLAEDFARPQMPPTLDSVLHSGSLQNEPAEDELRYVGENGKVLDKYTLSPKLWDYLQAYKEKHRAKGNGFGFDLFDGAGVARTLSARYHKDGSEILIDQGEGKRPRRLTPRECARLMGFDSAGHVHRIPVSDTQAYRQFGNALIVPVVREIAKAMRPYVVAYPPYQMDMMPSAA